MSDGPDPGSDKHVLLVGGGNGAFRAHRPRTRTTFLTLHSLLSRFRSLDHHRRVFALRETDPVEVWLAIARAVHAADPFDAVACLGEPLSSVAARIADDLDLTGVPSLATAERIVDKEVMRAHLAGAGVESVRAHRVASVEELRSVIEGSDQRWWIVKPAAGSGSFGVHKVDVGGDLAEAFASASGKFDLEGDPGNRDVLVEPFLEGPQFSVEAVTEDGVTTVLAITQKFSDPETFVELGHVVPAMLADAEADAIRAHVVRVLDALGLTRGVSHSEVVVTEQGPVMLETHARVGGDDIAEMASAVSGVDQSAASVDLVIGEPLAPRLAAAEPTSAAEAVWFVASPEPGIYAGVDGVEEARTVAPSVEVTELLDVGAEVGALESSDSRVLQVRASGETSERALEIVTQAAGRLTLRIARAIPVRPKPHSLA